MPLCKQWKQCKNFSGCASFISDGISSLIGIIPSDQPNNFSKWTQTFSDFYYTLLFNIVFGLLSIPRYTMIRDVVEKASRIGPIQVTYPLGQKCRITLDLVFQENHNNPEFSNLSNFWESYEIHSHFIFVNFGTPKSELICDKIANIGQNGKKDQHFAFSILNSTPTRKKVHHHLLWQLWLIWAMDTFFSISGKIWQRENPGKSPLLYLSRQITIVLSLQGSQQAQPASAVKSDVLIPSSWWDKDQ